MSKTISGFVLVGGILVALLSSVFVGGFKSTPDTDWLSDLVSYCAVGGLLVGVAMFFTGSLFFSRGGKR